MSNDHEKLELYVKSQVNKSARSAMAKVNADLSMTGSVARLSNVRVTIDVEWRTDLDTMVLCPGVGACTGTCARCVEFTARETAKARKHNTASRQRKAGKSTAPKRLRQGGLQKPLDECYKDCVAYILFREKSNMRSRASKQRAKMKQKSAVATPKVTESGDEEDELVIIEELA